MMDRESPDRFTFRLTKFLESADSAVCLNRHVEHRNLRLRALCFRIGFLPK
jgi:hypothetical protein